MQFKHAIILAAVAFCAVQAASFDDHERNRRSASDLFDKAADFVSNIKNKITKGASEGLSKVLGTLEKMEDSMVETTSQLLKKVGFNADLKGLLVTLKGNLKSCAVSDSVKSQAAAIKSDLMSCVTEEIKTIEDIVSEVTTLATDASAAPTVIENAVTLCKGQAGESFSFDRLSKCASALKTVTDDATIVAIPGEIVKNIEKAASIAASMKAKGASCLASKVKSTGSNLVNIAKSVASCVHSG